MASTIALKRRINSVKNTKQITKAMELVAASKMRRAQSSAQTSRAYRVAARQILARLSTVSDVAERPLFVQRAVKTRIYVVITSDRGLAGAYNGNVLKMLLKSVKSDQTDKIHPQVIAIGRQAARFARRLEGVELLASYDMLPDNPQPNDIRPILTMITDIYADAKADAIDVLYTDYKSSILQEATRLPLLPLHLKQKNEQSELEVAFYEPSLSAVIENASLRLLEVQLWQVVLESLASEHSMRMLAMKNATDNASDIIDDLTLEFNTARQGAITQELAEITGGAEAIK